MQQIYDWKAPRHDQIRKRSSKAANARIDRETREALDALATPDQIRERLTELDHEWTVDRALMLNFAIAGTISASLAIRTAIKHRRLGGFAALLGTQLAFLAHHAVRRWCPPMPVFRRLGFRSDREICAERVALEKRLAQLL
ncbi:MAG: hypothetical protein ABI867_44340 [Kofleriaceae bacterium]